MNIKTRLFTGLLWALAAYFAYVTVSLLQFVAAGPAILSRLSFDDWVRLLVVLSAVVIYPYMSSPSRRDNLLRTDNRVRLFQVFSGILAGFQILLLNPLFMERVLGTPIPGYPFNPILMALRGAVGIACVLAVAFVLTRTKRHWLLLSFVITASLLMLKAHNAFSVLAGVDPLLLLAGGAFLVFAYFFPGVARALVAGCAALFAVVFGVVGAMFGGGKR